MMLPEDRAQITLVFLGTVAMVVGVARAMSDSDHIQPGMMAYQTKGAFLAVVPKEAGTWLIVGGIVALGICFILQRK